MKSQIKTHKKSKTIKMKKIYRNFYGLALAALIGGMATSCTNELNEPTMNQGGTLGNMKLVHTPDVYAWSGDQVIGQGMPSFLTRAGEETSYDYNFPTDMEKAYGITPQGTAYTGDNQGSGTYIVTGEHFESPMLDWQGNPQPSWGTNPGVKFNDGSTLTVYLAPGAVVENFGNNISKIDLYISRGAKAIINKYSMNNCNIYNEGELEIEYIDGGKIQNIYNSGDLKITKQEGVILPDNVSIYSGDGGYVEFNVGEGKQVLINGTLVSNNIVRSNGNIKFQNAGKRDICWLQADGYNVEITQSTNIFGKITAKTIEFDGASIKLHPEGLIDIQDESIVHNSGSHIYAYDNNSRGLVKTPRLISENDPFSTIFNEGIYVNAQYLSEKVGGIQTDVTNNSTINSRVNVISETDLLDPCGGSSEPEIPEEPQVKECPKCHHPEHGDECDECEEGDPCHPKPEEPVQPEDPNKYKKGTDEVEVNFSINDVHNDPEGAHYDNADLWTKLSIHVRKATDVKIFIPLASKYLCESDDFNIFQTHQPVEGLYTGSDDNSEKSEGSSLSPTYTHSMDYVVNGQWTVTLNITITDEGIYVETKGINDNQELIDYLFETNGDGMNFEIWFYFQTETVKYFTDEDGNETSSVVGTLTQAEYDNFQNVLNGSTIEFKYNEPDFYINAFNDVDSTGEKFVGDCTVTIVSDQKSDYNDYFEGVHFNDSRYNHIYKLKSAEKPHPAEN